LEAPKKCLFFPPHRQGTSSGTYHTWLLIRDFFLFSFQVFIEKQKGEILGVVIVESGWGSILPTVIIANMMHGGPAEKSGKLNIGDQIMSINGTSLVGLPLSTCQSIIKVPRLEKTPQ
jgi:C-terminal processing protease CtpA/Prc